jgi:hypothetical protein
MTLRVSRLARDRGDFGSPLNPIEQRAPAPLVTHGQDFRVLHHDRCFGTGFDRKGDFGSPLGNPSTGAGAAPEPREVRTRFVRGGRPIGAPSFWSMTDKTDKKRDSPISYRPPAKLRAEFQRRVDESGLSANAYITKALFDLPTPRRARRPPVEKQMLAQLLARSAAIRDALDGAARVAGDDRRAADALQSAYDELTVIRAALLKMMERAP